MYILRLNKIDGYILLVMEEASSVTASSKVKSIMQEVVASREIALIADVQTPWVLELRETNVGKAVGIVQATSSEEVGASESDDGTQNQELEHFLQDKLTLD